MLAVHINEVNYLTLWQALSVRAIIVYICMYNIVAQSALAHLVTDPEEHEINLGYH